MDTRKRLEKVLTTALGQSFEECPNAKKVVIQQTLPKEKDTGRIFCGLFTELFGRCYNFFVFFKIHPGVETMREEEKKEELL